MAIEVRALLFDVFGTVVNWRDSVAAGVRRFNETHGLQLDAYGLADAWRAQYQPSMGQIIAGERDFVILETLQRENLLTVLREMAAPPLDGAQLDELNALWRRLTPWPDSVPGLTRLKTRFILAPMSNGNVAMMVDLAKWAGLPWDMVLGAELAIAYKPMPRTYLMGARLLGLAPAQCMMVAAHNRDLAAASALGFRTAFIPRPTEYGPNQSKDLLAENDYDVVADSLQSLADQLGC